MRRNGARLDMCSTTTAPDLVSVIPDEKREVKHEKDRNLKFSQFSADVNVFWIYYRCNSFFCFFLQTKWWREVISEFRMWLFLCRWCQWSTPRRKRSWHKRSTRPHQQHVRSRHGKFRRRFQVIAVDFRTETYELRDAWCEDRLSAED